MLCMLAMGSQKLELTTPGRPAIIVVRRRNVVPEPVVRKEIEKEADSHITLGRLLRKERTEKKKNAVQKILAGDMSVVQKIDAIREVDGKEDEQEVAQIVRTAAVQAMRRRISRLIGAIKESVPPLSYFSYLFRESWRIRDFGAKSRVLVAGILPPGVRADPALGRFLVEKVQAAAFSLVPRLDIVVEHGWLHLTPTQYNEVMLLRRLANRILAFDFAHADFRDRNVIEKLERIEGLFLMIHYGPATLESIVASLHTVYRKQDAAEKDLEEAIALTVKILDADSPYPSLANCLLGLNILRCRRSLTLPDLMRKGLGDMVSARDFDGAEPVRKRIDDYLEGALDSVRKLQEQVRESRRLNTYVSRDPDGKLDTSGVRAIYVPGDGGQKYDFTLDQQNLTLFVCRLLRRFDRTFSSLLNGQVVLEGPEKKAIFSRSFFQTEFSRMRAVADKLEKGPYSITRFPLSRYLQMKEDRLGAIGNELEARQLIDEGVAGLVDLGKTLARVLGLKRPAATGVDKDEPLGQVVLQGKPFTLPWEGRMIVARSVLHDKTVEAALAAAVSFCFTTGLLLQDQFLFLFLDREAKNRVELARRIRMVEHLLDPDILRQIRVHSN